MTSCLQVYAVTTIVNPSFPTGCTIKIITTNKQVEHNKIITITKTENKNIHHPHNGDV